MNKDLDFETIYKANFPRIHRYMTDMIGTFMAEDATQDVFNKVHKGQAGFKGKSSLSTWIYRTATDTVINKIRRAAFRHERKNSQVEVTGDDADKGSACRDKTIE